MVRQSEVLTGLEEGQAQRSMGDQWGKEIGSESTMYSIFLCPLVIYYRLTE